MKSSQLLRLARTVQWPLLNGNIYIFYVLKIKQILNDGVHFPIDVAQQLEPAVVVHKPN